MTQIAGIDEAGRGPLAGPVVAAAVVLDPGSPCLSALNDSKKLTEKKRNWLFEQINEQAISVGVSVVGPEKIEALNILGATLWGMKEAFERAQQNTEQSILGAMVDGNQRVGLPSEIVQHTLVKGDAKCPSIMAASIIAKVTRDRLMQRAAENYPQYGFEKHKGYGTQAHMAALKKYGPCAIHRQSFAPVKKYLMPQEITRRSQEDTDFASGQTGERLAELFLEKNKFKVVARRYRALKAEIDIIGYDKDVLCFVEVKSQKKISTVPPHHQVSVRKQAHLVRAARSYLQDHFPKQRPVCRFDVVSVQHAAAQPEIEWLRGAFHEAGF